jgi:uracil phosphoribosyltransferase
MALPAGRTATVASENILQLTTSPIKTDPIPGLDSRTPHPAEPNGTATNGSAFPLSKRVTVTKHPIAQHALTVLRNPLTPPPRFRTISNQLLVMLVMDATRTLPLRGESAAGSGDDGSGQVVAKPVVFLTVARHGLGLAHRMVDFFPDLLIGAISFDAGQSGNGSESRLHLPNAPALSDARVILFQPVVATGGSSSRAISLVRRSGATDIALVSFLVSAPGLGRLQSSFPDLSVWTASIENKLDARRGPLPGIGDFAERLYG